MSRNYITLQREELDIIKLSVWFCKTLGSRRCSVCITRRDAILNSFRNFKLSSLHNTRKKQTIIKHRGLWCLWYSIRELKCLANLTISDATAVVQLHPLKNNCNENQKLSTFAVFVSQMSFAVPSVYFYSGTWELKQNTVAERFG